MRAGRSTAATARSATARCGTWRATLLRRRPGRTPCATPSRGGVMMQPVVAQPSRVHMRGQVCVCRAACCGILHLGCSAHAVPRATMWSPAVARRSAAPRAAMPLAKGKDLAAPCKRGGWSLRRRPAHGLAARLHCRLHQAADAGQVLTFECSRCCRRIQEPGLLGGGSSARQTLREAAGEVHVLDC